MDERRTLALMAWAVGSVVGLMFILNGIALSFVEKPAAPITKEIAAGNAPPALHVPVVPGTRGG